MTESEIREKIKQSIGNKYLTRIIYAFHSANLHRDGIFFAGREINNFARVLMSDIALEEIGDYDSFTEDLGLDSLVLLEISVDIELQFGFEVSEDALRELHTVQDAVELVQQSCINSVYSELTPCRPKTKY